MQHLKPSIAKIILSVKRLHKKIAHSNCISSVLPLILVMVLSLATSGFNQLPWTKDLQNPIFSGGASGTWNRHVFSPMVLYNPDSIRFEMWYGATDGPPNWEPYHIGFATSIDGINWTKLDTAVLKPDPGMWDETLVIFPHVIRENGEYKMWYTGWSPSDDKAKIGYATSQNGIIWTKDPANPVMTPGTATWEVGGPHYGYVMAVPGGGYKMWYTGYNVDYSKGEIGYATSSDGITWARADSVNPVLTTGSPGSWDDAKLWAPCILFINNTYHMWYSGMRASNDPRWTGWATSVDCIHWNKYNDPNTTSTLYIDSDPVLKPSSGQWDENYAQVGTVMIEGDSLLRMWYQGGREPMGTYLWKIGHATAPINPVGINDNIPPVLPRKILLSQNYPNPFNPSTIIEIDLPKTSEVSLKVFNILGEEVATLVADQLSAGSYSYEWDATKYANGVYLYRLKAGDYLETRKMVLMK